MHYTEIVKVSPPLSPPSLALPKPVQDNTAQPPLSSSVETIASILVALCLLAIATAVVFVYRWRFGQSVKNNHNESEIALVQRTGTYWLIFVLNITSDLVNYIAKNGEKKIVVLSKGWNLSLWYETISLNTAYRVLMLRSNPNN